MFKLYKKGVTDLWWEIFSILIVVITVILLWGPISDFIRSILPGEGPDQRMENAMDRLTTEINALPVGQSITIPFDVDLSFVHYLEAVNICKKGEDPSINPCLKGISRICLLKGEIGEATGPLCKFVYDVRFKETDTNEFIYPVESRNLKISRQETDKEETDIITLEFI